MSNENLKMLGWVVVFYSAAALAQLANPGDVAPPVAAEPSPSSPAPAEPMPTAPAEISAPTTTSPVPPPPLPDIRGKGRRKSRPSRPSPQAPETRATSPSEERGLVRTEQGLIKLDFPQADIADVAKAMSELTKRNFILDERVRGKVTIISPTSVTVDEAYQAFISALEVKGFTVLKIGKIHKIIDARDMKTQPIPTDDDKFAGGPDMYVTRLIKVNYIKAAEIVKSLRGLVSKNGDLISYDPTNTLIITDTVGNLNRVSRLITKLDQQGAEESLEVIHLKTAAAIDMSEKLMKIFNLQSGGSGGGPTPPVPQPPGAAGGEGKSEFISKIIPDERTNSLIVLANKEGIRRVKEVVRKLDQAALDDIGKGKIHVLSLQYADATELAGTLGSLTGGGRPGGGGKKARPSTPRNTGSSFTRPGQPPSPPSASADPSAGGSATASLNLFGGDIFITADSPTNALVITASPSDYEALLPIIRKLDVRRPQAFIEAMILEVDIDKAFDVGVAANMGTTFGGGTPPTAIFGATTFGDKSSIFLPTSPAGIQGLFLGMQSRTIDVPIAGGTTLTLPVYGTTFRALQTNGTINVLSTPNILTSDNMEAEIVVGRVVPFITAQGRDVNNQPINQVQRENVAITLRVTPQINDSDDITMDIFQEIQDLIPGPDINQFGPTTSMRSTKTTVLVKDAQTVTVGGLIEDRDLISISKVPILGDIPILGWFFKSKSKNKRKISLVIFITPHIVRAPEDLEAMSVKMNLRRQQFLKENNVPEHPGLKSYGLDKNLRSPAKEDRVSSSAPPPAQAVPPKEAAPATEVTPAASMTPAPTPAPAAQQTVEDPEEEVEEEEEAEE